MLTRIRKDIEGAAEKAFTLIELIVVIIIIGILAAAAVPAYNSIIGNSRNKTLQATAGNFEKDYLGVSARDQDLGANDPRYYSATLAPNSGINAALTVGTELTNKGLRVTALDSNKSVATGLVVYDFTTGTLATQTGIGSVPATFVDSTSTTVPLKGTVTTTGKGYLNYLMFEKGSVAGCIVLSGVEASGVASAPSAAGTSTAVPAAGTFGGGWYVPSAPATGC